jgi:hypothetical protein
VAWDVACDNLGKDVSAVVGHGQAERSALLINVGWFSMVGSRSGAGAKDRQKLSHLKLGTASVQQTFKQKVFLVCTRCLFLPCYLLRFHCSLLPS